MENEDRILDSECHYFPLLMVSCPSLTRIYFFIYLFTFIYLLGIHRVNPESLKLMLNKIKWLLVPFPLTILRLLHLLKLLPFFFLLFLSIRSSMKQIRKKDSVLSMESGIYKGTKRNV